MSDLDEEACRTEWRQCTADVPGFHSDTRLRCAHRAEYGDFCVVHSPEQRIDRAKLGTIGSQETAVMDEIETRLAVKLYELESRITTLESENKHRHEGKKVPLELTVDQLVARVKELEAMNKLLVSIWNPPKSKPKSYRTWW